MCFVFVIMLEVGASTVKSLFWVQHTTQDLSSIVFNAALNSDLNYLIIDDHKKGCFSTLVGTVFLVSKIHACNLQNN